MSDWHPMSEDPSAPVQCEIFYGKLTLTDQDGNEISAVIEPYRDERRQMAYWDGEVWRYMGTGHEIYEWTDTPEGHLPTHWRPLPPLPEDKL